MKMRSIGAIALICAPLTLVASSEVSVTPIQKVLGMLGEMVEKAKAAKQAEMNEWAAFKQFCGDNEEVKQEAIQKEDTEMETLDADIEAKNAEVERLGKEIDGHNSDIEKSKKEQDDSTKDREAERATYKETHQDYSESITAVTNAISSLKKRASDIPQAASLLQSLKGRNILPEESKQALDNFLSLGVNVVSRQLQTEAQPEANAYEFQSDGIITMLEELKNKFIDEKSRLEKKEMEERHSYDMVMLDLKNGVKASENALGKRTKSKSSTAASSTESQRLFDETKSARDEDQKYLTGLEGTCKEKAADFETRQKMRAEEIEVIEKAMEIMGGASVSGAAEKHLRQSMVQVGTSFTQFLSSTPSNQQKAIAFLMAAGNRLDSHVLSALAMQATADPFAKVKKMVSDLISKLKAEEEEEADHKGWCDEELGTNKQTRTDKTAEVETLNSEIDELESRLSVLKKELATLSKQMAEINTAVSKATDMRQEEKDSNEQTIAEAVEGQTAVAQAKKVLSDFYAKAGENTAFVQRSSQPMEEAYQGQQKANSNVMSFLEVISSDFARLETDTKKEESAAQAEYDDFMAESKESKEKKGKEQKTKEKEQLEKTETLSNKNDDLESAQTQLSAAMDYFDKLKPSCVNTGQSYEERVAQREEEIDSCKEALSILNGETMSTEPTALRSSTEGGNAAIEH